MFPVPPDVLDWVQLRRVGRQILQADGSFVARHKGLHQAAAVRFRAIPDDQQFLFDVTFKVSEKLHNLRTADATLMQLKVKFPPRDSSYRRERLPVKRILQHRGLALWRPRPTAMRALAQSAFINEHDRASFLLGFFLSFGQLCFFHRLIARSSRSSARPVGRWQLHPSFPNSQPTWPGWYLTPNSCLINLAIRSRVHRFVSYPSGCGPSLSLVSSFFKSASLRRGLRPARPAFFKPRRPLFSICCAQRLTDWRCTPTRRATSASLSPSLNSVYARKRLCSNPSKSLLTPAGFPMQSFLSHLLC